MWPLYGYNPGTKKHRGCLQKFDRKHIKPHWWKQRKKFSVDGNHHHKTLLVTDEVKLNQKTSRERVQPRITKKKKRLLGEIWGIPCFRYRRGNNSCNRKPRIYLKKQMMFMKYCLNWWIFTIKCHHLAVWCKCRTESESLTFKTQSSISCGLGMCHLRQIFHKWFSTVSGNFVLKYILHRC